MSIYFLRYGDLIKIGFSSNLRQRIASVIQSIPGEVSFLGHMPGDREVEAHLHDRFGEHRFSGEWFRACPDILDAIRLLAIPDMPLPNKKRGMQVEDPKYRKDLARRLRAAAMRRFPDVSTHRERIDLIAGAMGWPSRRVRSVWHAEPYFLSPLENKQINQFTRRELAAAARASGEVAD